MNAINWKKLLLPNIPYLLFYFLHGIPEILFFITQVSTESYIYFRHYLSKISIASP